jgi:NAD+ synthase (glutamine-hydrolysing)
MECTLCNLPLTITPTRSHINSISLIKWLETFHRRFFTQQFKRSCLPDGPAVFDVSVSPRGGWAMPSDASSALWLAEIAEIKESLA